MHPFGMYLAITDGQREHGWGATAERRASFARVDALPLTEPAPVSRRARLTAILQRRFIRTVNA